MKPYIPMGSKEGDARQRTFYYLRNASDSWEMSRDLYRMGYAKYVRWKEDREFHVTITDDDILYADVHDWLIKQIPEQQHKRITVKTAIRDRDDDYTHFGPTKRRSNADLRSIFKDPIKWTIKIGGYSVEVNLSPEGVAPDDDDATAARITRSRERQPDRITFSVTSLAAQQAVVTQLKEILDQREFNKRQPQIWSVDSYGGWRISDGLGLRRPDTVKLPGAQFAELTGDIKNFLDMEDFYLDRGMPYHRGYLFSGPPGTGKTSTVKALAQDNNLDLFYIPMGDLTKDADLFDLLSQVRQKSILLLEDIDAFKVTRDRDDEDATEQTGTRSLSLSGLLNGLDGVATPHGLITIMTSNKPDQLDPALLRPGRVDRVEEFENLTEPVLAELFEFFYRQPASRRLPVGGEIISPAQALEIFKRNMFSPEQAEIEIEKKASPIVKRVYS